MPTARARSIQDWLRWSARRFRLARLYYGHGTDNADDEALAAVRWVLRLPQRLERRHLQRGVGPKPAQCLRALVETRITSRQPLAYLTGETWFAGLRFEVDPRVLVPRSPIAELIVKRFRPWIARDPGRILDLCAGSGCLAIACAKAFPRAKVDAAELDPGALQVLRRNIRLHRLGARVRAVRSDLFRALAGRRYDLIVTNPPYVPEPRWRRMPAEYHREPKQALAAGRDGMNLVRKIIRQAPAHLADGGTLVCEVGGSVPEFTRRFKNFPAWWPDFEHGGDGVLVVSKAELQTWNQKNVR